MGCFEEVEHSGSGTIDPSLSQPRRMRCLYICTMKTVLALLLSSGSALAQVAPRPWQSPESIYTPNIICSLTILGPVIEKASARGGGRRNV
jgi:hypothetical protein